MLVSWWFFGMVTSRLNSILSGWYSSVGLRSKSCSILDSRRLPWALCNMDDIASGGAGWMLLLFCWFSDADDLIAKSSISKRRRVRLPRFQEIWFCSARYDEESWPSSMHTVQQSLLNANTTSHTYDNGSKVEGKIMEWINESANESTLRARRKWRSGRFDWFQERKNE